MKNLILLAVVFAAGIVFAEWFIPEPREVPRLPPPAATELPIADEVLEDVDALNDSVQLALWVNELALLCSFSDADLSELRTILREFQNSEDKQLSAAAITVMGQVGHPGYTSQVRPRYFWLMRHLIARQYPNLSSVYQLSTVNHTMQWRGTIGTRVREISDYRIAFTALRDRLSQAFDVQKSRVITERVRDGVVWFRTISIERPTLQSRFYDYAVAMSMMNDRQRREALEWRMLFLTALHEEVRSQESATTSSAD